MIYEIPGENVSFGRGLAQRASRTQRQKLSTLITHEKSRTIRETSVGNLEGKTKVAETIQAMKAETRAQGIPLGETGRFTHGALTPDDEGELRYAVTASDGKVILAFGTPVEWIGMTPQMAQRLADALNKWASEA